MIAEKMEEKQYVRLVDFYYQLLYFQITCGRYNLNNQDIYCISEIYQRQRRNLNNNKKTPRVTTP